MRDEEIASILGEYVNELLNRVDGLERVLNTCQIKETDGSFRFLAWKPILDDVMTENPVAANAASRSRNLAAALSSVEGASSLILVLAKNFGRIPPK
jgi:hypothetical protein